MIAPSGGVDGSSEVGNGPAASSVAYSSDSGGADPAAGLATDGASGTVAGNSPDAGAADPAGAAIAAALAELDDLPGRPVDQHVEAYERAHSQLQAAMADADEA